MVSSQAVLTQFNQLYNSCVLASYALAIRATNPNLSVAQFFADYCRHYKLSVQSAAQSESVYASDFPIRWSVPGMTGFRVVESLHNTSTENSFVAARTVAKVTFISDITTQFTPQSQVLQQKSALLCATEGGGAHAFVLGHDGQSLYRIDPRNAACVQQFQGFQDAADGLLVEW